MAVQSIPQASQIVLRLSAGQDRFVTRTINNIKPNASDEDVYAVAVCHSKFTKFAPCWCF